MCTGSNTPTSLSLLSVWIMQHASGFLHSLRSSHQVVWSPSSISVLQHASRAPFFSLSQTYHVACPHPLWISVKWFVCFLSTLNQAHSIVCHHPEFHVDDKVQILPMHSWSYTPCYLSPPISVFWHVSSASCPSWVKHTSSLATFSVSVL